MTIFDAPLWLQIIAGILTLSAIFCSLSLLFGLSYFKRLIDKDVDQSSNNGE
tara:strand:- start:321 stop:476 length:156 start_codon:yes stop_codon:yes gene_type:complete